MSRSSWRFSSVFLLVLTVACAHTKRMGWSPLPEVIYVMGTQEVPALYVRISSEGDVEAQDRRSVVLAPRKGKLSADEEIRLRSIMSRLPEKAHFRVEKAASARDQNQVDARIGTKLITSDPNAEENQVLVEFTLLVSELYQRVWNSAEAR